MNDETNIKSQLNLLVELQKIDSEIYDLKIQQEDFPVRIIAIENALEEKKSGMLKADEELKKLLLANREKEIEMQSKEEKIAKYESDLYQIKNNKEYTALKQEIESIKADVSLLEEDIINLLDAISLCEIKCAGEKKNFENEKKISEDAKNAIKSEGQKIEILLNQLAVQRNTASEKIEKFILEKYHQILKNRGKTAVAEINDEFCGECNIHLRPQVINDARLKKDIIFCENCGRILYANSSEKYDT